MMDQVLRSLRELQAELGIEGDLDAFIRSAWWDGDFEKAEYVAELIQRAAEDLLSPQYFLWQFIVETEDCERLVPDGWYRFIAVHPETGRCLTFYHDRDRRWKSISFRARIRCLEDAVEAVKRLVELIQSNIES